MSYTKGKWYKTRSESRLGVPEIFVRVENDTESEDICCLIGCPDIEANARLIAAAPDLLYACKIAFNLLDSEPMPTPETESVIEKLSFAIGNAEQ